MESTYLYNNCIYVSSKNKGEFIRDNKLSYSECVVLGYIDSLDKNDMCRVMFPIGAICVLPQHCLKEV